MQAEADHGCTALSEPGPKEIRRDDVLNFSPEEYHTDLCNTFPILMTTLTAIVSKGQSWEEARQVNNPEVLLLVKFCNFGNLMAFELYFK